MLAGANTFWLSVLIGVVIGGIHAYFMYVDTASRRAAAITFCKWLAAFAITGVIATPIAQWLLTTVL